MLISLLILVVVALVVYWIATTFFPEPMRMVVLVVVGILCIIALLNITGLLGNVPPRLLN